MRDPEIRRRLRQHLEDEFGDDPTALILDELGVCCGRVRADMAVVNGELKGFEIKSDQDTLFRLRSQASLYCRVFDTVSLVVASKHLKKARKIVPHWWGILLAEEKGDAGFRIRKYRCERRNPGPDAFAIAQLIWRDEAFELLRTHNLHSGLRNKPRKFLWDALVRNFALEDIQTLVRTQLKARRGWRSVASRTQDDEKSPLSSTS
jgi:hypothetical protein